LAAYGGLRRGAVALAGGREGELARLRSEGVAITMPLRSGEWGERAFQVRDPNGVIIELLDWNAPSPGKTAAARRG
jgi:hypothetical protein